MIVDIVIPAYNEADHFRQLEERLIQPLRSAERDWEFQVYLVVNDDSDDGSPEIADWLASVVPEIKVVHRRTDPGFGNALKDGFREGDGDVVIPFMADFSDNPLDIPKLVAEIQNGYDYVYGSRFAPGGSVEGYPRLKLFYNRSFNNLVRLLFGVRERDVTNAFSAYRRKVLEEIDINSVKAESFDITAEIPLRAHILGFSSTEVPVTWESREAGVSKLNATQVGPIYLKRLFELFVIGNVVALTDLSESVTNQSRARVFGGAVIGVTILLLLTSLSGLDEVFGLLRNASPTWIVVAAMAYLGSFVLRTWRWRVLLRTSGHITSRGGAFRCILGGWFVNFILPARAGDVARAFALKTTEDVPFSVGAGTIVIERIYDMLVLSAGMLLITLLFVDERYTLYLGLGAGVLAAILFGGLIIVYFFGDFVSDRLADHVSEIESSVEAIQRALEKCVRNPFGMGLALLISAPVWLFEASTLYFSGRALGFSLPVVPIFAAGTAAFVSQAVPVTPAGVGTFEVAITAVLSLFGVPQSTATGLSLLDHFTRLALVYVVGAISLVHIGFQSRTYFRSKQERSPGTIPDELP